MGAPGIDRADLLVWADGLVQRGLAAEATALYRDAADADPTDVHARAALARCLLAAGDPQGALSHLDGAWTLPASDEARSGMLATRSTALLASGRAAEALQVAREAVRLDPAVLPARYALVLALLGSDLADEAEEEVAALHLLGPDLGTAHYAACLVALHRDDVDEADTHLRRAIEADPDDALLMVQLGAMLLQQERHRLALEAFLDALREFPDLEPARLGAQATVDRMRGRHRRAWLLMPAWLSAAIAGQVMDEHPGAGLALYGLAVAAVAGYAVHAWRYRRVRVPPPAERVLLEARRRRGRVLWRAIGMAVSLVTLVMVGLVLAGGSVREDPVAMLITAAFGVAALAGVAMLGRWDPRQRVSPRDCRCEELSLLHGKPARRYAERHLQVSSGSARLGELWCTTSGHRWVAYDAGGPRLARLPAD